MALSQEKLLNRWWWEEWFFTNPMTSCFKKIVAFVTLLSTSGCSFIMGSPRKALATNPTPDEVITPVLIYTSDCDFQKAIDNTGWIGASTSLPASYAAEAICKALNRGSRCLRKMNLLS